MPENFFSQFKMEYEQFQALSQKGLIQFELPFDRPGCQTSLKGSRIISFASNDYLSMLSRRDVIEVGVKALNEYGTGAGSSMLGSGSLKIHRLLSEELAEFLEKEAVVLFPTGFSAMLGFGSSNVLNGGAVYSDSLNHRSIIDGLKLGQGLIQDYSGSVQFFKHNSLNSLKNKYQNLLKEGSDFNYHLLFVEGAYSMSGDQSDLVHFVPFCKENKIMTAVDDAHGIGVLGKNGRGTASEQGVSHDLDFILGTFSKTFASTGGFIAGPKEALEYLRLLSGVYMFSASLVPANVEVVRYILKLIRNDDSFQKKLLSNIELLKGGLDQLGFDYGDSQSAVIPIYIGESEKVLLLALKLLESGFYVVAAVPPAVPEGSQLIRVSVNAGHTTQQIEQFLNELDKISTQIEVKRDYRAG